MHRLGSEILFKNLPLNRGRLLLGVRSSSFKNEGNSIFNPFNRFLNQKFEINESGCVGVIHANKILEYCDDPNDVEQALKDIRNFYITYKTRFPYGCKAFGVISKKLPYLEVKSISGIDCALFSNRNKNVIIKNKKGRLA